MQNESRTNSSINYALLNIGISLQWWRVVKKLLDFFTFCRKQD